MKITGKITEDEFRAATAHPHIRSGHKVPRIWVLVADRHRARLFSKPEGRLEEIGAALPSRHHAAPPSAAEHHNMPLRGTPEEKESWSFAHDIAAWLEEAARDDAFDRLVLAAAPHMLGDLRKALGPAVHGRVVAEIDKDLTRMGERDLHAELENIVWI